MRRNDEATVLPPELAIARADGKVSLWATHEGFTQTGKENFSAINGAWDGQFYNNQVLVKSTKTLHSAAIVWRGTVPEDVRGKYWDRSAALAWIRAEVDAGRTGL